MVGDTRPVSMEMTREQKGQKLGRLLGEKPLPGPKVTQTSPGARHRKAMSGRKLVPFAIG